MSIRVSHGIAPSLPRTLGRTLELRREAFAHEPCLLSVAWPGRVGPADIQLGLYLPYNSTIYVHDLMLSSLTCHNSRAAGLAPILQIGSEIFQPSEWDATSPKVATRSSHLRAGQTI